MTQQQQKSIRADYRRVVGCGSAGMRGPPEGAGLADCINNLADYRADNCVV